MTLRSFCSVILQAIILTSLCLGSLALTFAQVRTSSSYQLQSDSINFGGGLSTSTNYSLESTAGEIATGPADSTSYSLRAGYQQMQEVFLSLTGGQNVSLSPSIGGLTGGTSNGSTSVVVLTDSPSGYELTIVAANSPAMQNGAETIADYVPVASPAADFTFTTGSTDAHFGFSPEGDDIVLRYKDSGGVCGVDSLDTTLACWDGLSTSDTVVAQGPSNQPNGATTTINFRVGVGGSAPVVAGTYIATTTLTAIPL
ncbi:hypothetical protein A2929_03625 [Candidatus Kaiserbacteria bacterium RIFCSPLOWO2_01_FULL_45_25]|uniref:Uncharacterized protein n=1 Tax=Candidatus Kaiserbacteria bacterium RIFCSPLOWO2_12_FULL_45_26 TaxID=1798525 RepID=A0A1F6FHJ8_9BACT|nr:MAG: hypothetical protein A2Z56_03415 [Candidatus Kaiserbacteria bacterium RIFCSPHIGHO2_12_45_16]OGG70148.1 MAG: hypothetical protein A2929_03625 [Candidatus Kaiserbacteria bacterium RIFCSPLOWO2_01_FULL_45_25]OGG85319.1 MAG: hypothetical protein A3G90_04685 [Candidatus Kaiserbacteria bacterium RIFCSPLOWO2_12_FULL_45_26]